MEQGTGVFFRHINISNGDCISFLWKLVTREHFSAQDLLLRVRICVHVIRVGLPKHRQFFVLQSADYIDILHPNGCLYEHNVRFVLLYLFEYLAIV